VSSAIAIALDAKRSQTLKRLPANFKCANVICDFCGDLGQVKTVATNDISQIPKHVLGAAWGPQKERMQAGFISLYFSSWYPRSGVIQSFICQQMYKSRKCLSLARRYRTRQGGLAGVYL
jgi:hypothetical protein